MSVYADTSFLASLYLRDLHSQRAWSAVSSHPQIWLTALHRAEWTNAVAQHIFRRSITEIEAQEVHKQFARDRAAGLWSEIELPGNAFERCIELARKYTPQFGARTLDILHVAAALELKAAHFWTFDQRQAKLAKAAGLKVS